MNISFREVYDLTIILLFFIYTPVAFRYVYKSACYYEHVCYYISLTYLDIYPYYIGIYLRGKLTYH